MNNTLTDSLNSLKSLQEKAESITLRRIKAWGQYAGYNNVRDVRININNNLIYFMAYPISSGIGWPLQIPLDYLFNDENLEKDALNWYKKEMDLREKRSKRIQELK